MEAIEGVIVAVVFILFIIDFFSKLVDCFNRIDKHWIDKYCFKCGAPAEYNVVYFFLCKKHYKEDLAKGLLKHIAGDRT